MHRSKRLSNIPQQDSIANHRSGQRKATALFFCFIALFTATCSHAGERRADAIHIKADHMQFDLQSNSSVYKGNVTIRQGEIKLSGDNVEIVQSNNMISRIIASGNPARFQLSDEDGKNMQAQSKHIEYFADDDRLIMQGEAKLVQNKQLMESSQITYDTKNKALIAGQQSPSEQAESEQPDAPQRVKMTLTPNTK